MSKDTAVVKPSCQTPIPLNTLDVVAISLVDAADAKKDMSDKISAGNFLSTGRMLFSYVDNYCKGEEKSLSCPANAATFAGSIAAAKQDDTYKKGYDPKVGFPRRPFVRGASKPEEVLPVFFIKVVPNKVVVNKVEVKQDAPDQSAREPLKYGQSYYLAVKKIDAKVLLMDKDFNEYRTKNMPDGEDGLLYLSMTADDTLVWSCVSEQIATWTITPNESVLSRKGSAFQTGKEDYPDFAKANKDYVMAGDLFSLAPTKSGFEKYVFSSKTYTVSGNGNTVNIIDISSNDKLASSLAAFIYKPAVESDKKSKVTVVYDMQLELPGTPDTTNSVAVQCIDALQDAKSGLRVCDNGQWAMSDSSDTTVSFTCGDTPSPPPPPPPKSMLPIWAWVLIALGGALLIGIIVSTVIGMTNNPIKSRIASMMPLTPIVSQ